MFQKEIYQTKFGPVEVVITEATHIHVDGNSNGKSLTWRGYAYSCSLHVTKYGDTWDVTRGTDQKHCDGCHMDLTSNDKALGYCNQCNRQLRTSTSAFYISRRNSVKAYDKIGDTIRRDLKAALLDAAITVATRNPDLVDKAHRQHLENELEKVDREIAEAEVALKDLKATRSKLQVELDPFLTALASSFKK